MLDHIGLAVAEFDRAKAFYRAALKPLGLGVVMEVTAEETGGDAQAGFGDEGKPFFWIGAGAKPKGGAHNGRTDPRSRQVVPRVQGARRDRHARNVACCRESDHSIQQIPVGDGLVGSRPDQDPMAPRSI